MTIQFNCPNCGALIAFESKHVGKRARCLTCNQLFIIPEKDNQTPKKVKPPESPLDKALPLPGFFRAALVDNWKIFFDRKNVTTLAFVAAAVCFKFFLCGEICCAPVAYVVIWGWLLGFYLNVIYETAFGIDELPEIYLGTSFTFFWYIVKPFATFFFTMFAVQFPFIIALSLLQDKGLTYYNMWQTHTPMALLLKIFFISGIFIFPMAILTTAIGKTPALLRPDYLLAPILKALIPYLLVFALLAAACLLETRTVQMDYTEKISITASSAQLGLNLAVQVLAIIAMRSIGLFYKHYQCYLRW